MRMPINLSRYQLLQAFYPLQMQGMQPFCSTTQEDANKMIQAGNAANDRASGEQAGIEIAIELIQQVKSYVSGIYLMPPFKRYDMAATIIEEIRSQTP